MRYKLPPIYAKVLNSQLLTLRYSDSSRSSDFMTVSNFYDDFIKNSIGFNQYLDGFFSAIDFLTQFLSLELEAYLSEYDRFRTLSYMASRFDKEILGYEASKDFNFAFPPGTFSYASKNSKFVEYPLLETVKHTFKYSFKGVTDYISGNSAEYISIYFNAPIYVVKYDDVDDITIPLHSLVSTPERLIFSIGSNTRLLINSFSRCTMYVQTYSKQPKKG